MKRHLQHNCPARRGVSLMEVTLSTMIVGMLMVASLKSFGQVTSGRNESADDVRAKHLCRQLMAEIMSKAYEEPVNTPQFGREAGEPASYRTQWDDVDDYNGSNNSAPYDIDGWALDGFSAAWSRAVSVDFVTAADPSVVAGSDEGLKRIKVTVRKNGSIVAEMVALRSDKY
jgi:MSHA pilin protein MshD